MTGQCDQVQRRIGRAAERGIHANGIEEGFPLQDVGRLAIGANHLDDLPAGLVRALLPVAVRRRDRRRTRQRHAQHFRQAVHRGGRAHRVAVSGRGRGSGHPLDHLLAGDLSRGITLPRVPHHGAGTDAPAIGPGADHRPDGQGNARYVDGRRSHQAGRRRLVATDRQDRAVDGIAIQDFNQAEVGEVPIESGGRPLAGLLDRMHREFQWNAARIANALADPRRQHQVVPIAGRQVGARLRDADDRPVGLQLAHRQPVIHVPLQVQGGHLGAGRIVEPGPRTEAGCAVGLIHVIYSDKLPQRPDLGKIAAQSKGFHP